MKHVVALSGGKDSTALALWLVENEPRDYTFVCTPTGDELPEMFDHWNRLSGRLGARILPIMGTQGLSAMIEAQMMLPNHRARWCTRILKLEPYYRWLAGQAPAVSYVGLRADEEKRQGMIFPDGDGITVRFPLREIGWGVDDVWGYLDSKGVTIPRRTDCARCYHQTLGEWWALWDQHPDIYADAEAQEARVSKHRGRTYTFRSPQRDTWPAGLSDLRGQFEAGRVPRGVDMQGDLFVNGRERGACRVCSM